ncbi:3-oxoacyl-ACP reductase FabG [Moorella sulfitireducens (nom. illeg.)]|uniref:3-oxoacyl-ACP reductase FabG n=1 Tax=Neomoorella sulfitireducens TaxID=2972948 RepID=UPI0021ABD557|nr:3-oxoacyl-ACP reductase FabG [Moorella sulfitireducens]
MRLKDKVAVITGGASGIGAATAKIFGREGAAVAIVDLDAERGAKVCAEISASGGKAAFFQANVADRASVKEMVEAVVAEYNRIDILVNNAGIIRDAMLVKMMPEQWDAVLAVNLTGVFNCTQAVVPLMIQQGAGRILVTSSLSGICGNVGQTNYVATKAGVIGLVKTWAKELGPKGITVNAVAPGFIATEMTAAIPQNVAKMLIDKIPLRRVGMPEDVANAFLFLASEEGSYINGAVLSVDGGLVV